MADTDFDRQSRATEYEPSPTCFWCSDPMPDTTHEPYCSSHCAILAERDDNEDFPERGY